MNQKLKILAEFKYDLKPVDRGYANRTLGYHLPNKQRQAGAEIRGQLESVGIYRKTGHEHFAGSLVIPVFDDGTY